MRILILGGGGMLGHKLWQHFSRIHPEKTWVTLRKKKAAYEAARLFSSVQVIDRVNVDQQGALESVLEQIQPKVVLNCIGITKRHLDVLGDSAARVAIELNAHLPHRIAEWTGRNGGRLIHFSTDCVFDGKAGNYPDSGLTNAEDLYGRTKALGEVAYGDALTLRSSFIGRELTSKTELLEWLLQQKGRTISGYRNAIYSGLTTLRLAKLVERLVFERPGMRGLYNVSSRPISKYELLCVLRDVFKLDVKIEENVAFRCDRSLDSSRFQGATGFRAPEWKEMAMEFASDPTPYSQWKIEA